jgi:DNA polymerase-3 subunit alpha
MLEDLEGAIEVMIFPSAYQLCATILAEDAIVFVKGRIDKREDVAKIIAMEVTAPDLTAETGGRSSSACPWPGAPRPSSAASRRS